MNPDTAAVAWQPTAPLANLHRRAQLLAAIRQHFAAAGVLEVETPQLGKTTVSDPHLRSIEVPDYGFLQTSPEYAMKRLLAAGSGSIYQIARAFRGGEAGRRHNPEFSLLEWYRVGFSLEQLMDEVAAIAALAVGERRRRCYRYRELFQAHLDLDPLTCDLEVLRARARCHTDLAFSEGDRDLWLDLLMSYAIEPRLPADEFSFIVDYPASQAALARLRRDEDGQLVAERFELFHRGVELANGYHELQDCDEQTARFTADLRRRRAMGLPVMTLDDRLLAALAHGLPDCCGVALGVDRLLMLAVDGHSLADVLAFPVGSA